MGSGMFTGEFGFLERCACRSIELDERDAGETEVRAGGGGVVDRDGEDVFPRGEVDGQPDAADFDFLLATDRDFRRECVGFGAGKHVVAGDFLAIEVDDDAVVSLAAELELREWLIGGEAVAEVGRLAFTLGFWRTNVDG